MNEKPKKLPRPFPLTTAMVMYRLQDKLSTKTWRSTKFLGQGENLSDEEIEHAMFSAVNEGFAYIKRPTNGDTQWLRAKGVNPLITQCHSCKQKNCKHVGTEIKMVLTCTSRRY